MMNKKIVVLVSCLLVWLSACTEKEVVPPVTTQPPVVTPTKARTFYVSPTGNDTRTLEQAKNPATPWRTIQKAANSIVGGDTVIVGGGTYVEKVTVGANANGTAAKPTLFRNKKGETVIIDGQNAGARFESLFRLNGVNHVTVKGLKAQNSSWYGFSASQSTFVTIDSCSTFNTQASGIQMGQCSDVKILRNNIRRACQLPARQADGIGGQECITLGRTHNFQVSYNEIYDINAFLEGGEGIDPKGSCYNGEISYNYCHDLARVGIYLDASTGNFGDEHNIRVFSNRVINCGGGISVAGELGGHIRDIYIYNNLLVNNTNSGVLFQSIGNGRFSNIYIVNNTLYNNAQVGFAGDIANFSKNTLNTNIQIKNNIFYNKTSNYRFSIFHDFAAPHVISHNLYFDFKPGMAAGNAFTSSNLTAADVQADPQFNNVAAGDFTLKATSPAINRATPITLSGATTPLFNTDFNGKPRGVNWDMGAFEF